MCVSVNLTQVVFDVADQPGQHCCVFVNETSDQDVVNCIVVTDRNHIAVTVSIRQDVVNCIVVTDRNHIAVTVSIRQDVVNCIVVTDRNHIAVTVSIRPGCCQLYCGDR